MKIKNIYILTLFILFNTIFAQNVQIENLTFDEAVNYINDVPYNKKDYDDMISNLITLLNNNYIYLDIAKNPPPPFKPVDVIKELESIKTNHIKFYEFYQKVNKILLKLQDGHLQIFFKKILDLEYLSPLGYYTRTINDTNYLFCGIFTLAFNFFNESFLQEIGKNSNIPIKSINGKDPFDYVQTFGGYQKFKSEHAQFTFNINRPIYNGKFHTYPFIKEDLTNITIEFNNSKKIIFDYKILKPKIISPELKKFYEKEMKKYSVIDIIKPTIIEIEKKFVEKKNNKTRNLQQSFWNIDYEDKIKLKVDHKNKVNVLYQSSFNFIEVINNTINIDFDAFDFFILMSKKIHKNNYPIVIIEDFNPGGLLLYDFVLLNVINPQLSFNTINMAFKANDSIPKKEIESDKYENITHQRTKVNREDFIDFWQSYFNINGLKKNIRKPTEIIVFTDSFSYSATSIFIKNLQESGNAIIVGYNGNPSEKKKNEKFDSSQSPSPVNILLQNDKNAIKLNKYGIKVDGITYGETFNDSYINKDKTPIPREYLINPIDERSNIYGRYYDYLYDEFINEAKRIFKKYETECNPDNKYMVLLSDTCKFDDKNKIGGFKCINGKWSKECQVSNCKKPYTFNTYTKECESNVIIKKKKMKIIIIVCSILIAFILFIIVFILWKKCKKTTENVYIPGSFEVNLLPSQ